MEEIYIDSFFTNEEGEKLKKSRLKMIVSLFLAVSTFFSMTAFAGSDLDAADESPKEDTVVTTDTDIYTLTDIDELYKIRSELALDFDNNIDKISEVDKRLEELGVEEISYKEVYEKVNGTSIGLSRVAINSSSTVKWTSTRQTTGYNGKTYEMQIIRGVPASLESELYVNLANRNCSASANTVLLNISNIKSANGTATCDSNLINRKYSDIFGSTTGSNVQGSANIIVEYLYVFVKYSGDLDTGNQIKAYVGSRVQFGGYFNNGSLVTLSGNMYSEGYNSYASIACKNFFDYKNGNSNFNYNYMISNFQYQLCSGNGICSVPYPLSGY